MVAEERLIFPYDKETKFAIPVIQLFEELEEALIYCDVNPTLPANKNLPPFYKQNEAYHFLQNLKFGLVLEMFKIYDTREPKYWEMLAVSGDRCKLLTQLNKIKREIRWKWAHRPIILRRCYSPV